MDQATEGEERDSRGRVHGVLCVGVQKNACERVRTNERETRETTCTDPPQGSLSGRADPRPHRVASSTHTHTHTMTDPLPPPPPSPPPLPGRPARRVDHGAARGLPGRDWGASPRRRGPPDAWPREDGGQRGAAVCWCVGGGGRNTHANAARHANARACGAGTSPLETSPPPPPPACWHGLDAIDCVQWDFASGETGANRRLDCDGLHKAFFSHTPHHHTHRPPAPAHQAGVRRPRAGHDEPVVFGAMERERENEL